MFALEVLVQKLFLDRFEGGVKLKRHQRHMRDALESDRVLHRLRHARPPGERRVPVDENAGEVGRIAVPHRFDDDVSRLPFIVGRDRRAQLSGDGRRAVEKVGVRRAEDRDRSAGLRERGRVR